VALGWLPEGAAGEELLVLAERSREGRWEVELEERVRRAVLELTGVRAHTVRILAPGTLPRTSSGKMRRGEALRRFLAGSLAPPRRAGPIALAWAVARSALALARRPERR
jgi:acyl-coenzyme A synthetase/AMP-(fatty) acid ligase